MSANRSAAQLVNVQIMQFKADTTIAQKVHTLSHHRNEKVPAVSRQLHRNWDYCRLRPDSILRRIEENGAYGNRYYSYHSEHCLHRHQST
jgi:hypothetical protein